MAKANCWVSKKAINLSFSFVWRRRRCFQTWPLICPTISTDERSEWVVFTIIRRAWIHGSFWTNPWKTGQLCQTASESAQKIRSLTLPSTTGHGRRKSWLLIKQPITLALVRWLLKINSSPLFCRTKKAKEPVGKSKLCVHLLQNRVTYSGIVRFSRNWSWPAVCRPIKPEENGSDKTVPEMRRKRCQIARWFSRLDTF